MVASKIMILEACTLLREGLVRALTEAGFHVQSAAHPWQLPPEFDAALLLVGLDDKIDMPVQVIKSFKERYESSRIFVLTSNLDCACFEKVMVAGANGLLSKATSFEVLIRAIELVLKGEAVLPSLAVSHLFPAILNLSKGQCREAQNVVQHHLLSSRELHVLHRLAGGESNKAIARHIQLAESTVKVHIKAILRKLGVQNRTQAALWAIRSNLADLHLFRDPTVLAEAIFSATSPTLDVSRLHPIPMAPS